MIGPRLGRSQGNQTWSDVAELPDCDIPAHPTGAAGHQSWVPHMLFDAFSAGFPIKHRHICDWWVGSVFWSNSSIFSQSLHSAFIASNFFSLQTTKAKSLQASFPANVNGKQPLALLLHMLLFLPEPCARVLANLASAGAFGEEPEQRAQGKAPAPGYAVWLLRRLTHTDAIAHCQGSNGPCKHKGRNPRRWWHPSLE